MSNASSLENSHAGARHFCDLVRPTLKEGAQQRILVAGCGEAHEALHIRQDLGLPVVGVDIEQLWDADCGAGMDGFDLLQHSILALPFADSSFEVIFYHHVIEHVSDPVKSLDELHRVLVPGGLIYVGTPNRHRAIGYLGGHGVTTAEKLRWNWADYKARFRGRFRNEYGAHAGFSERELASLLLNCRFEDVHSLTADYMTYKYAERLPRVLLSSLCQPPVREFAAAAVYATARKPRFEQ